MEKKKEVIIPMPVAAPATMSAQSFDQRDNAIRQEQLQRLYDKYPSEPTAPAASAAPPSMWNRALNYISTFVKSISKVGLSISLAKYRESPSSIISLALHLASLDKPKSANL